MKYIITEEQQDSLSFSIIDDIMKGYEISFDGDERIVSVNDEPLMKLKAHTSIVSNKILDELKNNFYYENKEDLKNEVREWIIKKLHIKSTRINRYGIKFGKL